jgi:hypothetical protein
MGNRAWGAPPPPPPRPPCQLPSLGRRRRERWVCGASNMRRAIHTRDSIADPVLRPPAGFCFAGSCVRCEHASTHGADMPKHANTRTRTGHAVQTWPGASPPRRRLWPASAASSLPLVAQSLFCLHKFHTHLFKEIVSSPPLVWGPRRLPVSRPLRCLSSSSTSFTHRPRGSVPPPPTPPTEEKPERRRGDGGEAEARRRRC